MKTAFKAIFALLSELAKNPFAYVIVFSTIGAGSIVSGVAILAGTGWAFVTSGVIMIATASYITRGMKPNG